MAAIVMNGAYEATEKALESSPLGANVQNERIPLEGDY